MPVIVVPGIAAIVLAIIALLAFWGIAYIAKMVANLLPSYKFPIIGSLRSIAVAFANTFIDIIGKVFDQVMSPINDLIEAPIQVVANLFNRVWVWLQNLDAVIRWTILTYVPREIASVARIAANDLIAAEQYTASEAATLRNTVAADLTKAEQYAATNIENTFHVLSTDITNAVAAAAAATAGLTKTVAKDLTIAEQYAATNIENTFHVLSADIAAAEAYTDAQVGALGRTVAADVASIDAKIAGTLTTTAAATLGIISTDIDKAIQADIAGIEAAVDGAITTAAGGFGDITEWLGKIDLTKPLDIAGVSTIALSVAGALSKYLEDCGMPNCRNLSALGRDLQALLGLVENASLLALFVGLATDPEGVAQDVATLFTDLADPVISSAKDLLGVG